MPVEVSPNIKSDILETLTSQTRASKLAWEAISSGAFALTLAHGPVQIIKHGVNESDGYIELYVFERTQSKTLLHLSSKEEPTMKEGLERLFQVVVAEEDKREIEHREGYLKNLLEELQEQRPH